MAMNNLIVLITSLIMTFSGWLGINRTGSLKAAVQKNIPITMGAWEWGKIEDINPQSLTETAKRNGVKTIYLNVNEYADWYELEPGTDRETKLANYLNKLAVIVSVLKADDIQVQAVAGENNWAQDSHWYLDDYIVEMVREFNTKHPDNQITGIQLDIEPYGLADWDARQNEYMNNYYLLVEREAKKIQREVPDVQFGLAIPSWYAQNKTGNKTMLEQILPQLNNMTNRYLALMDYRNSTDGSDGSIELAKRVFDTVDKYSPGTGIVIAQETGKTKPEKITFFGHSRGDLIHAIDKLRNYYGARAAFAGFAINNLETFNDLQ